MGSTLNRSLDWLNKLPKGLWWIKDRVNSNDHQLVDSVRGGNLAIKTPDISTGEVPYVPPAGDSVAWCWNVDSDPVNNTDGTIAVQCS